MDDMYMEEMVVPVLPLRGLVMFPDIMLHFDVGRKKSILAIEHAMDTDQYIFLSAQKHIKYDNPGTNDVYTFGIVGRVKQVVRQSGGSIRALVEGKARAEVIEYVTREPYISAKVNVVEEIIEEQSTESIALVRKAKEMFQDYINLSPKMPPNLIMGINMCKYTGETADYIASNVSIDFTDKQEVLSTIEPEERLAKLLVFLTDELEILRIENDLSSKLKKTVEKNQKEYYLREQMKIISQELGSDENPKSEADKYKRKLKRMNLPKDAEEKLLKDCERYSYMSVGSSESNVLRSYLDTCLSLPWNKTSKDNPDIDKAESILEKEHFGLEKIKERMIELLAVKKLSEDSTKGQIICLVGPPGVGKTSIAKSVAHAMGRKYVRISLGGIRDESDIRGHRRTYIGAMPGRIISSIKRAGTKNPLILLDEVDKLCKDIQGDPSSALLEALDPEQNKEFYDHYIDVPFDLGEVIFMATANDKNSIPKPLLDRMETISLYSYTHEEKYNIAKKYLIPKQMKKNGLNKRNVGIIDDALRFLIDGYTKEAGVRELERKIASLMRKSARIIVSDKKKKVSIDSDTIKDLLGPEKFRKENITKNSEIGIVKGLAWTSVGGETMPIEVELMKGKGKLQLTGSLGDVMKESAQIAVSYIRSHSDKLGISSDFYNKMDIHIHAPEGAIPKDGPSAGVTMTTAIFSALSKTPVKQDVAMTGEVTLKGKVLSIGGLKEKTMAAYREGIKTVIIPKDNQSDLYEIDNVVRNSLNFIMADNLETVFMNALDVETKTSKMCNKDKNKLLNKDIGSYSVN